MITLSMAVWLAHADSLRIVTAEEPPTNYLEAGELQGMSTEIVRALLADLQQNPEIEVLPWARAYQIALSEPNVLIFTAGKTPERVEHGFTFIGPVTTRRHILYSLDNRQLTIRSIDDLRQQGLRIGGLRGDWRTGFFKSHGISVEETASHLLTLRKLQLGRIDLMISSDLEIDVLTKTDGIKVMLKEAYVFDQRDAYLLFSKGTQASRIHAWQAAFQRLQRSSFFATGSKHWSAKLGVNIRYRPESGYYIAP
jgi:ABC-type amino acid transport substrate-binding protein